VSDPQALRDLQSRLAERLQVARTQDSQTSWLAVEAGGRGFLFPLKDAGEIFPVPSLVRVPHTRDWFLGVANLRGALQGVVGLARFLGLEPNESAREQGRVVALNPVFEVNAALLVERLAGLRRADELEPAGPPLPGEPVMPPFVGDRLRDRTGRVWQELKLSELAADEAFLAIVV
jgi:twitching motility protein PilI